MFNVTHKVVDRSADTRGATTQHIGGSDLLHELHAKGGLLPLVAKKPAN